MLNECVEKHITIWELWGEEYDPEADYQQLNNLYSESALSEREIIVTSI